ncbi:MAG: PAS domain-containing protein, partial [Desulfovibrionaceae bacterium]
MADLFSRPEALLAALLLLAAALGVLALFGPRLRVLARRARARSRELLGRDPGPGAWPDVLERALEGMGAELARLQAETAWMEQERRRAERFFSDVFDAVSDGIAVLDTDLRLVRANAALRGIYGEEMLGRPCREVFPQRRAVDCERCPARDAMRRRRPVRREVAFRRPDGGAGVLELAAFPLLSPGGELTGAVEFSRDVTERAELTRVRRRWEFMVNTAPDPMTLISAEGRLESANQAYCRASGRSEAELTGRTMAELWGETAWESLIRPSLERALAGEAVVREAWFRFPGLPEPGYYEVSYHPYFGAGGAVRGAVVVSHDITARHQAETALRRAHDELEARVAERTAELTRLNAELLTEITERRRLERSLVQAKEAAERADRAKGEFLANMSHEVRTPLSAIIGLAEIGRDTAGPEPSQLFAQVLSESGALLGVLNAVLDYSKIESGHLELEHIPFNLRYLVEDLAAGFAVQCARKGLELIAAVAPDAPERLVGDPGRLRQALANLVNNAVKFTDRGE